MIKNDENLNIYKYPTQPMYSNQPIPGKREKRWKKLC